MTLASIILLALGVYVALGVLVGIPFVVRGVSRVDRAAAGAPIAFKLLILPGVVGLWPMVLSWWLRAVGGRTALNGRARGAAETNRSEGTPR